LSLSRGQRSISKLAKERPIMVFPVVFLLHADVKKTRKTSEPRITKIKNFCINALFMYNISFVSKSVTAS
jgi:hypothetical protein